MAALPLPQNDCGSRCHFRLKMLIGTGPAKQHCGLCCANTLGAPFTDLDYDDYRTSSLTKKARFGLGRCAGVAARLPPGWVFDSTVSLFRSRSASVATPLTVHIPDDFVFTGDCRRQDRRMHSLRASLASAIKHAP